MKMIIAGSRTITDIVWVNKALESYLRDPINPRITEVVWGGAKGVDGLGYQWAIENKIATALFLANWEKHGKSAGFIRNREMANYADAAIVVWDGQSKGSKNMIETMKKLGKPVYEVVVCS